MKYRKNVFYKKISNRVRPLYQEYNLVSGILYKTIIHTVNKINLQYLLFSLHKREKYSVLYLDYKHFLFQTI